MASELATSATPEKTAFTRVLAMILDDDRQRLVVAQDGARLVGYLYGLVHPAFHANGNIGWMEELFVDSDQRGTGLGRALVADFEVWARAVADAQYVAVATRRADAFYEAIDYSRSATYFKKSFG